MNELRSSRTVNLGSRGQSLDRDASARVRIDVFARMGADRPLMANGLSGSQGNHLLRLLQETLASLLRVSIATRR